MSDYNRVILCGRLGRDAELRFTAGGQPVATLSLATTEKWKDRDGNPQEFTEWSRVVVWGKTAKSLSPYLVKGKQILVEGKLRTRQWDDKDGIKRYSTEIKADRINLVGSARANGADRGDDRERDTDLGIDPAAAGGGGSDRSDVPEDDIPF